MRTETYSTWARSLRGRNDRSEKVGNRDQIFPISRCIVVLFVENFGGIWADSTVFAVDHFPPRRLLGQVHRADEWQSSISILIVQSVSDQEFTAYLKTDIREGKFR